MILISSWRSRTRMMGSTPTFVKAAAAMALATACVLSTLGASASEQAAAADPPTVSASDSSAKASTRTHADRWEYDPYYVFPLIRHMPDSGLPLAGQIALYPLAFVVDLGSWPVGALAGLAGK